MRGRRLHLLPLGLALCLVGCETLERASVDALRAEELRRFGEASRWIQPLLDQQRVGRVRLPATLSAHSGTAVAMLAPVDGAKTPDELVQSGGIFGVLWLSADPVTTPPGPSLREGIYALRFDLQGGEAFVELLGSDGDVAYRIPAVLKPGIEIALVGDFKDKVREKLRERDLNLLLVDIEILLGRPSKVRGSILFWSFDLFDDP